MNRLSQQEKRYAQALGTVPVLLFVILTKLMWKFKRQLSILIMIMWVGYGVNYLAPRVVSPKADATHPIIKEQPTSEQEQIIDYINEVFGKDAPKAFQLLHGTNKCHGENGSLNPHAKNLNADGSIDYGLFQWNDYWNGFNKEINNERYLFDYKIATDLAYRKFVNDGYSFKEWTGGKCQGI